MSTSPTFVALGYWPSSLCGNIGSPNYTDTPYYPVGPFNLSEAMAIVWNAESLYQVSPFDTVSATYGGSVTPPGRVCTAISIYTSATHGGNGPTMVEMKNALATDGYGNYFIPFNCMAVTVDSSGNEWTIWNYPYPYPDRYYDHQFYGTVLGKTVTFYCYHAYASVTVAWPFSDSMSVSVTYWNY